MESATLSFEIQFKVTVVFLTLATLAYTVEGQAKEPCHIAGANITDVIKFPFITSIHIHEEELNLPFCCGSVLNSRWVLTAGQCLVEPSNFEKLKDKSKMLVSMGLTIMSSYVDVKDVTNVYRPQRLVVHPKMVKLFPQYDVGMIMVARSITLGARIAKVPIPSRTTTRAHPRPSKPCTVVSWGISEQAGKRALHYGDQPLKFFRVQVMETTACESGLPVGYEDLILCTKCIIKNEFPCMGDIGAPLMCDGRQVGLVSWTKKCDSSDSPVVNTRINAVQDWMDQQIYGLNTAQERPTSFVWVLLITANVAFESIKCV